MSDPRKPSRPPGITRRRFIKGVGVGTVTTSLLPVVRGQPAPTGKSPQMLGPGELPVTLSINGQERKLNIEPRVTLLDALRNRLDLTGAKKVCDRGTCGACTVLVDGRPIYSCSMLAIEAQGRKVVTIEGLGTPEKLSPVQRAFVKHDAQQCGFCTPGFVVACTAFLRTHRNPTLAEVRQGLGGNLCRCGTYAGITEAVLEAAKTNQGGI